MSAIGKCAMNIGANEYLSKPEFGILSAAGLWEFFDKLGFPPFLSPNVKGCVLKSACRGA